MPKLSAGVLVYRQREGEPQVFLVHPGGPFWQRKDDGAWTIPKGEFEPDEDPKAAALREFEEETGHRLGGEVTEFLTCKLPSGKVLRVWSIEDDLDETAVHSNTFEMEWPPKSGRRQEFPEVDRAGWFTLDEAARKITSGQRQVLAAFENSFRMGKASTTLEK